MKKALTEVFSEVKTATNLPENLDFKVISNIGGFSVNRKKEVETLLLRKYLDSVDGSTRVASFTRELGRRIGAQVGARIELHYAGTRIDGRRSIASLR
jgi:hypothetical protein